jgi:hypothetical protein
VSSKCDDGGEEQPHESFGAGAGDTDRGSTRVAKSRVRDSRRVAEAGYLKDAEISGGSVNC